MIIQCCACKKGLGQKPPYTDKRVTHTYCALCLVVQYYFQGYGFWQALQNAQEDILGTPKATT